MTASRPDPGRPGVTGPRRPTGSQLLAGVLVALFVIGLVGWLVQGAGSDRPVSTVPATTPAPPTEPPDPVPNVSVVPSPETTARPDTTP